MRKLFYFALPAILLIVAIGIWRESRTHPRGSRPGPLATAREATRDFHYAGVRFQYEASLFAAAHGEEHPAQAFVADEVPDGVGPARREVLLDGFAGTVPHSRIQAAINVYRVEDFDDPALGSADLHLPQVELMLLRERLQEPAGRAGAAEPSQAMSAFLPYMPVTADAGQVLAAKLANLRGPGIEGIRYLTAYSQEAAPVVEGQLFYTFQGLAAGGRYYVAASFPLQTGMLPARVPESLDFAAFERDIASYQRETIGAIDARRDAQFTPALDLLDALVQSITVE
jgi:hypothetical protein